MDQRWGEIYKNMPHIHVYVQKHRQMNDLPNINLYLLSVWDRWGSWWQNAGPTTQPPASQPYESKRHLPRCQNHRISSCERALPGVCVYTHRQGINNHIDSGPGHAILFFLGKGDGTGSKIITWRSKDHKLWVQMPRTLQSKSPLKNVVQDYGA